MALTTEQLIDLIGCDDWLMIKRASKFNMIVEKLVVDVQRTSFVNVPTGRFVSLRQYWEQTAAYYGLPDDPHANRSIWFHVIYRLVEEHFPEDLRLQLKKVMITQPETPPSIEVVKSVKPKSVKITPKNEKYLLDVGDMLW